MKEFTDTNYEDFQDNLDSGLEEFDHKLSYEELNKLEMNFGQVKLLANATYELRKNLVHEAQSHPGDSYWVLQGLATRAYKSLALLEDYLVSAKREMDFEVTKKDAKEKGKVKLEDMEEQW